MGRGASSTIPTNAGLTSGPSLLSGSGDASAVARQALVELAMPFDHLLPAVVQRRRSRGAREPLSQRVVLAELSQALSDHCRIAADQKAVDAIPHELANAVGGGRENRDAAGGSLERDQRKPLVARWKDERIGQLKDRGDIARDTEPVDRGGYAYILREPLVAPTVAVAHDEQIPGVGQPERPDHRLEPLALPLAADEDRQQPSVLDLQRRSQR